MLALDSLLSTQMTLLNRFFEQAPFPMGLVEVIHSWTDIRYVFANRACSQRFGLDPEQVRSIPASSLLTQDDLHAWLEIYRSIEKDDNFRVVSTGVQNTPSGWYVLIIIIIIIIIYTVLIPLSLYIRFETYCSHVRENYFLFLRKDITQAKQLELALQKAKDDLEVAVHERTRQLEQALQVKTRFLAMMYVAYNNTSDFLFRFF